MDNVSLSLGLDYASSGVQLCAIDERGKPLVNRLCRNDWRELVRAVEGHGLVKRVAIEACSGAADLAEELIQQAGWHVELAHPHYVAKLKGSPDKSDFTDARLLADLTRVGYLPRTWLPPAFIRDLRQRIVYRQTLVNQRRAMKLRIGALLREHRVPIPKEVSRWSCAWVSLISQSKELSDSARWIVEQLLQQIRSSDQQIAQADRRLRSMTKKDAVVTRLLQQEGIGEVTAWTMRAFIGQFDRFNNGKQLSRYCGLSPRNASSGTKVADAGLIKMANKLLRTVVIQAAHRLIRTSERWGRLAESMRCRGKPACVIVAAVGNRWVRALHHQMTSPIAQEPS